MSYQLGDTAPETPDVVLARIDARTAEIQQFAKDESVRRKWALVAAIAGAMFAAVKLGIVAIPHWRARRRSHAIGELATNPQRQRRSKRRYQRRRS